MSVGARINLGLFVVAPFTFCFVYLYVCSFVFWKLWFVFCSIDSFVICIWFWKPSFVFWKPSLLWPAPFLTFFELFVLFLDLCIFLCLVLSDISSELNTGRSGETISGFWSPPSLGCPFWTLQVRSILSITGNQNIYTIVQTQQKHKSPVVH